MNYEFYLHKFQQSAEKLDKTLIKEKQLQVYAGITLDSVVLKLYKKEWANDKIDPINSKTRIFFAIWVNDKTIKQNKIFYNIHALKLRELKGYSIISGDFVHNFREGFKKFEHNWNNVSVNFGPLTLMEGWEPFKKENLENIIVKLAINFLKMDYLIDETLKTFKKADKKNN